MANYSLRNDYNSTDNITYSGRAVPGTATSAAGWSIMKVTYNSNSDVVTALWASGTDAFNAVWDNRASYTYS